MGGRKKSRGQILPLFVLALVAILAMAALLFDGAYAYVQRRKLQDAGDAAALAGSNALQTVGSSRTCSTTSGPPPGAPRADIVTAVLASIDANVPGFDHANVTITCPSGWQNLAVRVDLRTNTGPMFAGPVLGGPINVGTASTAINGQITGSVYSVAAAPRSFCRAVRRSSSTARCRSTRRARLSTVAPWQRTGTPRR
jgi:uncharacterized membrane protein